MSSTFDRLRRLQGLRSTRTSSGAARTARTPSVALSAEQNMPIERFELGETVENHAGQCYLVTRRFPLHIKQGETPVGSVLLRDARSLAPVYPTYGLEHTTSFHTSAFLDTETNGLGGGASIYAFMVGVGTFEPQARGTNEAQDSLVFVVRQLFMRHPGEEPALLTALADLLGRCHSLVTFNGRSFDVPLLRGRYRYASSFLPQDIAVPPVLAHTAPHLDLLHPARRLWQKQLNSCTLSNLEQKILKHTRTQADIPGREIPQRYSDYLRSHDGRLLQGVFYHNRQDILSMAVLAEVICGAFAEPVQEGCGQHPLELLSRARLHLELNRLYSAETLFRAALQRCSAHSSLAESFDGLGRLLKRQQRWEEAAAIWQQWLTTVPSTDIRPYVELAKFCEWQTGDLEQAAMWTQWALHEQEQAPAHLRSQQDLAALQHRLARLQRKLHAANQG